MLASRSLTSSGRGGPSLARHGDDQGDQGDDHDRRGDEPYPAAKMVGQAAEPPDHRDGGQDEQPGDDVLPQRHGADGGERERCPGPGLGQLPRNRAGWWSSAAAYRSAEISTTTAAMTAITVMTAASSRGMTDRGSGWPCRIARWLRTHSPYAATATTAPNTISGTPSTRRPQGTPGNGGSSWTTPRPDTTSASAVRLQARNVRSLAKVNRG